MKTNINTKINIKDKRQEFLQLKKGIKPNQSFKDLSSRRLQMFSGKRGK